MDGRMIVEQPRFELLQVGMTLDQVDKLMAGSKRFVVDRHFPPMGKAGSCVAYLQKPDFVGKVFDVNIVFDREDRVLDWKVNEVR